MELKISQTSVQRYARITASGTTDVAEVIEEVRQLVKRVGFDVILNVPAKYTITIGTSAYDQSLVCTAELKGVVCSDNVVTLAFLVTANNEYAKITVDIPGILGVKY